MKMGVFAALAMAATNLENANMKPSPSVSNHGCYGGKFSGVAKAKRLAKKMKNQKKAKRNG